MVKKIAHKMKGLYSPSFEKDNCGFGLIANMDDVPSHWVIETSINALKRLTHRGAVADDGKTSDGCGLLIKKPHDFGKLRRLLLLKLLVYLKGLKKKLQNFYNSQINEAKL